jgi:outer membrane receptor protein involved in Fe transport
MTALAATFAAPAAPAGNVTHQFDIPSQDLESALRAMALASKHKLLYSSRLVEGKHSLALRGEYTIEEALETLLEGTELRYEVTADGLLLIRKRGEGAADRTGADDSHARRRDASRRARTAAARREREQEKVEEVLVTAQKTLERVQDVPLSVSTVSGAALESAGATRLTDYAGSMPGFLVNTPYGNPGVVTLIVRGISTVSTMSTTVATYIDDVPVWSSSSYNSGGFIGVDLLPHDLDRIEVLKGPQGTLYGANSLGGLLKYVTKTADLHEASFRVGTDVSTVEHGVQAGYGARAAMSVPLIPGELAVRLSGKHQYFPGYIDNVARNQRAYNSGTWDSGKLAVVWQPSDELSIRLGALYDYSKFDGQGTIAADTETQRPRYGFYKAQALWPQLNLSTTQLYSLNVNYDLGWGTLTSVTGYSEVLPEGEADASALYVPAFDMHVAFTHLTRIDKFTQEVRLASSVEQRFQWLVGTFYAHEKGLFTTLGQVFDPVSLQPATGELLLDGSRRSRFEEAAVFANGTYEVTGRWDISAGIRATHNRQSAHEVSTGFMLGGATSPRYNSTEESPVTYSLSARYRMASDALVYARIATGYRPGGSNNNKLGVPATFGADTLVNYEIGLKGQWLDRRLLANLTAFYIDWQDVQIAQTTPSNVGYTGNGGSAVSQGVEWDVRYAFPLGLTIGANGSYSDGRLTQDAPSIGGRHGDALPIIPRWAGNITADYSLNIAERYRTRVGARYGYIGRRNTEFPGAPANIAVAAYDVLDVSAGLSFDDWDVGLYIRNATDAKEFIANSIAGPVILQPRTIGLSLDKSF